MAKGNITIREVAERAGVAVSTVSRVLSGSENPIPISEDTRQKVLLAAKDLSYRPHPGARLLRSKTTNTLGLIVREIEDPFFAQLTRQIRSAAKARGYEIALGYAEAEAAEALKISELMIDLRYCDGLLLAGDLQETGEDVERLNRMGWNIPLVLACRGSSQLVGSNASISTDNRAGALLVMEYLTSLGHREIAFLGGGRAGDLQERQETYRQFMQTHFGTVNPLYIQSAENSMAGGNQGMQALLSLPQRPTAVFASDDNMAVGAMHAAYQQGVRVPQDISLIGFDDISIAAYLTPPLTTIRQPVEALSQQAVALIENLIKGESDALEQAQHISLMPELVIRASCRAI
jgi:DNA-binding LacI/PurR family transcriptional regulator